MKLSMNLERRSVLIIAIVLFLAVGINTIVLTYVASDKYEQATLSRATYVTESKVKDINNALNLGLPLEYMDELNGKFKAQITEDSSLAYLMVTDTRGKVLFHSDAAFIGQELNDPISQEAINSTDIMIQSGETAYDISHVLKDASDSKVGVLRVGVKADFVKQQLYSLLKWAVGISVICFVFFVWIVYFSVSKFIANPIMDMEKVATMISNGDLTKEVGTSGKDEILKLSLAINSMASNLREMISKVQENTGSINVVSSHIGEASQRVLTVANVQKEAVDETASAINETNDTISAIAISSEKLTDSAQDASSAVSEMTMSISRVSESSHIFSDSAQETASSIEEMIASIREIAKSLDMLSSSSEDTASALLEVNATIKEIEQSADESVRLAEKVSAEASQKGMDAVIAASRGMEEIKGKVGTLSESINRLESRSEEIGQILTVIDDVADQTNLLALNAAILAAQAGEHGDAFAVVAEEIKGLAERTSISTKEIANLINAVQTETRSSVEMTAEGLQSVNKGIMLVSEVSLALRSIHESSVVSTEMSRAIQRATQEEANVIRQITDSIRGMTEQVEHISRATKEQSKGSKLVMDAAEKIKELAEHIKQATSEQMLGSQQIAEVSENVSLQAEQIMKAISSQKKKNAEIAGSMEKIKHSTRELDEASTDLDMVINSIKEASQALLTEIQKFLV